MPLVAYCPSACEPWLARTVCWKIDVKNGHRLINLMQIVNKTQCSPFLRHSKDKSMAFPTLVYPILIAMQCWRKGYSPITKRFPCDSIQGSPSIHLKGHRWPSAQYFTGQNQSKFPWPQFCCTSVWYLWFWIQPNLVLLKKALQCGSQCCSFSESFWNLHLASFVSQSDWIYVIMDLQIHTWFAVMLVMLAISIVWEMLSWKPTRSHLAEFKYFLTFGCFYWT